MQTHCQERTLGAGYDEVHAVLSVQPTRKAMVFVHGYGGDPLETWAAFDTLLPQEQKCGSADLFFYGYDAIYSELVASAGLFGNFLNDLMTRPAALINPVVPAAMTRPNDFQFDQVVLVAHSLGAVITRWSLLDARELKRSWLNSVKFVLFAPAHSGAEVYWLATYAASGFSWLKPLVAAAAFRSPLIRQLEKDSAELQWLRTKTEQAVLEDGPRPYLLPQHVIIAEKERVVKNLRFGSDPQPKVIAKTNHQSVCKPTETFRDPLRYVVDCL